MNFSLINRILPLILILFKHISDKRLKFYRRKKCLEIYDFTFAYVFSANCFAEEQLKRIKLLEVISEPEDGLKRQVYLYTTMKVKLSV